MCERWNALLLRNIAIDRFITFFYAQLDGSSGELRYVNAGHNPPVVMHRDGSHHRLEIGGGVLGIFPRQRFDLGIITLQAGDRMVLFTDGVTEAGNLDGEEFGEQRLIDLIRDHRTTSAKELQQQILTTAGDFTRHNWSDDATLLVVAMQ